jgi:hypothetical protein
MSHLTVSHASTLPPTSRGYGGRAAPVAILALLALLISPSGANAAPPTSPLTTDPADAAAGWLTGELVDGDHLTTEFDLDGNATIDPATEVFPDYGLTADAILAFAAAGSAGNAANAATDYLAANVSGYAGDGTVESYAGSLAKLILVADIMGRDPTAFGGRNLITDLQARLQPDCSDILVCPHPGRYSDASEFGDFSNPLGQALAIIGLERTTTDGAPATAVDFLVSVQCADGGFVSDLSALPCATGEVDTTALAVQALALVGRDAATDAATAYLIGQQAGDGSFAAPGFGNPPVTTANANSTGLAAQALRVLGSGDAADDAVGWLLGRQIGADGPQEQQGAFAFDATGFDPANATRATTQAILGVAGIGFAALAPPADPLAYGLDVGVEDGVPPPPAAGPPAAGPPAAGPPAVGPPAAGPPAVGPPAAGPPAAAPAPLPATGAAPRGLIGLGFGLLGVGIAASVIGRRRTHEPA